MAQVAIWLLAGLVGLATGIVAAIVPGPDAMDLGPAIGMPLGGLPVFAVAFMVLWLVAWRRWFRQRMPAGRFLLSRLGPRSSSSSSHTPAEAVTGSGAWRDRRASSGASGRTA